MKKIMLMAILFAMLCTTASNAQLTSRKAAPTEDPTPENVLKWTNEVLPKMERLVPKLEKIKADNQGKPKKDALSYLATVTQMQRIHAIGKQLKADEAKRYYDQIANTVNLAYIECKSQNNNVCCVQCTPHGFLGIWCFANCFVAKFPPRN